MLPNKLAVVERVHAQNPGLIYTPHEFTNAVAYALWLEDPTWGHNIKRGTQGLSEDAICKLDDVSPLKVTVPGSPRQGRGIYVVDIIGSAGTSAAYPVWIDQTRTTIDRGTTADWSRPVPVNTTNPDPEVPPIVDPPTVVCDCSNADVLAELARMNTRMEELAAHFDRTLARITSTVGELNARRMCRFL